jgi:uncharacterized protein YdaL
VATTLILYDTTGAYGHLGELYAIGAANLAGHFGTWQAKPVGSYAAGELERYTATLYFGSTYDEPIPAALRSDVLRTNRPVIWCANNIWQLASPEFTARYGWDAGASFFTATGPASAGGDGFTVGSVQYKGTALHRYAANNGGIINPAVVDPTEVTVLATANRSDGLAFPWATRSANLTYIGEIPFTFMSEEDRMLIFADLLFDALDPRAPVRHRAMVRFEDLGPTSDPAAMRAAADYLASQGVPFGFGVFPVFQDPRGVSNEGVPLTRRLAEAPEVVSAFQYLISKGGVMVAHGYTHQWDGGNNPYNQMSGDDFEFFRVVENPDHTLTYAGPLPGDSVAWASSRLVQMRLAFMTARLPVPAIFEFPHYAGSASAYQAVATQFPTRWERSLYYGGTLRGGAPDHTRVFGQFFPYAVRDVYGMKVLPENLGSIELEQFYIFPPRLPADLVNAASKHLVVRDGVACFYYHPDFVPLSYLQETVSGIKNLGYTFVSPASL